MFHQTNRNNTQQQVDSSISSSESSGKGSVSSSRPPIRVNPREIGPVTELNENDVLCGRGGRINGHNGNIQFRYFCSEKRDAYLRKGTKKIEKAHIAASVVEHIRDLTPPGRFLKQESDGWYDIGCAKAMAKVGQAIREQVTNNVEHKENTAKPQSRINEPSYPVCRPLCVKQEENKLPATTSPRNGSDLYPLHPSMAPHPETRFSLSSLGNGLNRMSYLIRESVKSNLFHPCEERFSFLSSGPTRMSCLMRESVMSDLSVDMTSIAPSNEPLEVRRQSIFTDISDCTSLTSLGDGILQDVDDPSLAMQEEVVTAASFEASPFSHYEASPFSPYQKQTQSSFEGHGHNRTFEKNTQRRNGSIWSLSITSNLSFGCESVHSLISLS